jgi:hypothetical protein
LSDNNIIRDKTETKIQVFFHAMVTLPPPNGFIFFSRLTNHLALMMMTSFGESWQAAAAWSLDLVSRMTWN